MHLKRAIISAASPILMAASALPGPDPITRIDEALQNVTTLTRPGRVGYATVWDGNKAVQCRRMPDRTFRCEAAGASMQPSLEAVLTPPRLQAAARLGWSPDPSFGNQVQAFPADMPTGTVARHIADLLTAAYEADLSGLETRTAWVADEPCPPRSGRSQNLACLVSAAPVQSPYVVRACAYAPDAPAPRADTRDELLAQYGGTVAAELQRLRINASRRVFVVLDAGIGYIQCAPNPPRAIYCEAQSAQSWPALAAVLTPERLARLRAAGFAEPGRSPNHWRDYPLDEWSDAAIASSLLTTLRDAYGYAGATRLRIATE